MKNVKLFLGIILLAAMGGCFGSKKVDKLKTSREEKTNIDSTEYWKLKYKEFQLLSAQQQTELKSALNFSDQNVDALAGALGDVQALFIEKGMLSDSLNRRLRKIFDSLQNFPCKSTLETKPDGSIKATGLKTANIDYSLFSKQINLLIQEREEEKAKRVKAETELKAAQSIKHKKTKNLWWLFFVGYALGWVLPPKKMYEKIKTLITKI